MAALIGILIVTGKTPASDISAMNHTNIEAIHIHPHLSIVSDGKPMTVPQNIGISSSLHKDHSLDKYVGSSMQGMAPLHTHTADGIIHVESGVKRNYTLGEFLDIWGNKEFISSNKIIKMSIDGKPIDTGFRDHILRDGEKIKLEVSNAS